MSVEMKSLRGDMIEVCNIVVSADNRKFFDAG